MKDIVSLANLLAVIITNKLYLIRALTYNTIFCYNVINGLLKDNCTSILAITYVFNGISHLIIVPLGEEETVSLPPTRDILSCIFERPRCPFTLSSVIFSGTSNPLPSSSIFNTILFPRSRKR